MRIGPTIIYVQKDRDFGLTKDEIRLANALRESVKRIKSATTRASVSAAIQRGNVQGALDAIRWDVGEQWLQTNLPPKILAPFAAAGKKARASLTPRST